MTSYKEQLNKITTLIFDIDGVLTDGNVFVFESDYVRVLNSKDGYAIQQANKQGLSIFVISGGTSESVRKRLLNLGVKEVHLKAADKLSVYEEIKTKHQLIDDEILYMGDDIPDLPILRIAGLSTCPQDAAVEIKATCHYQSPFDGGKNCVRDVIEQTLRVQGKWMNDETAYHW